jgi:hypothetical protein
LNFVQIRPWQNIAGYTGIALDITKEVTDVQVYMLPKFKMLQELEIMKATAAHGTKGANVSNNNVELRFSLRIDDKDPNWIRWQNYRVNHIELT